MKVSVKLIMVCAMLFVSVYSIACDISVQVVQTNSLTLINGSATCTLRVVNNSPLPNQPFSLTINSGNYFIGNTVVSPANVVLVNAGATNPVLDFPANVITGNEDLDVVFTFGINNSESCNIVSDFQNQPYRINDFTVSLAGCGNQTDLNAPSFSVFLPKFKVNFADDPSFTQINQIVYRKVEIINNGNLDYDVTNGGGLKVQNLHNADFEILDIAKEIGFNTYSDLSVFISNPLSNSEYIIDQADFNTLMSGSNILPQFTGAQKLVYYEKVRILQCVTSISSILTPYWEANALWCPTNSSEQSYFNQNVAFPALTIPPPVYINPPRDYCYGSSNENDVQVTLQNVSGTTGANNISVHLFKNTGSTPNYTEINANSFIVTRTENGVTTTLNSPADYTLNHPVSPSTTPHCDGQFYYDDFVIDFADNLTLPNGQPTTNNIKIVYSIKTCCPASGATCFTQNQYYDAWRVNASYGGFCDGLPRLYPVDPLTPIAISGNQSIGNSGGFSYEGPYNIFVPWGNGSPPTFSEPYDVTFSYTGIGNGMWPLNTTNYQFYIDVKLESDLVFCGTGLSDFSLTSSSLGTINPTSATFTSGSNNPGIVKTLRLYFTLTNNITNSLANSDLKFCIKGHCPNSTASIDLTYYYLPDANCSTCVLPFACYSQPLTVQCPGCLRQGIHSDSYRISRTTFGLVDANNNGRWDGGSQTPIDASNLNSYPGVKKKRVMVGDEFEGVLKTHVELNGYQPFAWSYNGSIPPQLDFYHGYWHSSFSQGQNITPIGAWVQIIETEASATCTSPPCTTVLNLPAPQTFNTINSACYGGISGVDFFYDFSISALQTANPGASNIPTRFSQGMKLEFHNKFRQTGNVGVDANAMQLNEGNNLIYLTLRPETSPNVYGVPGGCPQDPDNVVGSYGGNYDTYCTTSGTPFPCEDIQWFCTKQGDTYTQVGFATGQKVGGTLGISSTGCRYTLNGVSDMAVGRGYLNGGVNVFPFEYRNWSFIDHVDVTFPVGFTPLGLTFGWLGYNSSGYPHVSGSTALTNAMVTNLTPTSATLIFTGLTDDGSENPVSPGTYFGKMDDSYYYDAFHISFDANCNVSDGNFLPIGNITWNEYQSYAPQLVGFANADGTNPITANPDPFPTGSASILHNSPDITIQNQTPNVSTYGFNDPVTWDVLVTNTTSGNGSANAYTNSLWIALTPTANTSSNLAAYRIQVQDQQNPLVFYDLVDANGTNPGLGNYQIGNLYYIPATAPAYMQNLPPSTFPNNFFKYKVSVYHVNCSEGDELQVNTGWLCSAKLNTMTEYQNLPCSTEIVSDILIVEPTPSDLLVCVNGNGCDLNYTPVNAQPCSTVTYQVRVESHELGFLDAINFNMTLLAGSGLSFSGNATITYQGVNLGSISPVGNTLSFNLSNALFAGTGLDVTGLPGVLNGNFPDPDDHFFIVTITLQTGCEFSYNLDGGFQINVDASCCQQLIEQYQDFYNPILESPTFNYDDMDVSFTSGISPQCGNIFSSSVTVVNNSTDPSNSVNNVLYVDVPTGVSLTNFSVAPVNPLGPSPYIWSPSTLGGLVNGSSATITFDIQVNNMPCGSFDATASVYTDDNVICQSFPCAVVHQLQSNLLISNTITAPSSSFTLPTTNPCTGVAISFTPDVICPGVVYEWNIDGTIYTGTNATHTFNTSGNFNVSLTASLGAGGCSSTSNNSITIDACGQPCDGTKFTTSINSCTVDFTASPANNYANDCDAVMYAWNFNDGSPIPPYSLSNTVTHTFPASGTYTVCMAAICYDIDNGVWKQIEYCKYCEDVVVDCRKGTCKDVKFTSILTDCKIDLTAYAPGMAGCSSIEYEWNYGDGNSSGITTSNTISYTYTTEGTYNLCLTAYCLDEYGRVIATCRYCEEVKPECKNCGESKLIVRSDQCNASFEASVPGMSNCTSIEYVWYPGDGTAMSASTSNVFNFDYCTSGIRNVCFEANCYDANLNLQYTCKVCEDVDIKCVEPFCIKVENPLAGSYTGVDIGRQIVTTPDGGYVIVGTVNSNNTTPANTNATNEGDTYFAKFDANNNIEFQLRLGDISGSYYNERGHSVLVRPDGYYVSGLTYKSYGVDHDIQIVKISLNGSIEWGKRYGNNNNRKDDPAKLLDMSANGSGNILVVGSSNNSSTYNSPFDISLTNSDFIAFVIDPSGNQVGALRKRYHYSSANTESEYARDAIKINIGNGDEYVIAGDYAPCTTTPGCTDRDAYIIKLDANLNVTASQKLSLPSRVETVSSVEFLNGQIIVGGSNQLTGSLEKAWLATLNATNLSVISSVEISNGLNSNSKILGMNKSADNKLLIAGRCTNNANDDGLGIQFNLNGGYNIDWSVYSNYPSNKDYFSTITEKYLVTGLRKEAPPFVEEITISKLCAANGLNCCVENLTTAVSPITYSDNGQSYSSSLSLNTTSVLVDIPAYSFPVLCSDNTRLTISSQTMPDGNIVLYPNPNTGKFTIKSLNENLSILKIIIRDFSGREIYNVEATSDNIKNYVVDRELNWNSGLYSVVIIDSDDQKHTYKISILK